MVARGDIISGAQHPLHQQNSNHLPDKKTERISDHQFAFVRTPQLILNRRLPLVRLRNPFGVPLH